MGEAKRRAALGLTHPKGDEWKAKASNYAFSKRIIQRARSTQGPKSITKAAIATFNEEIKNLAEAIRVIDELESMDDDLLSSKRLVSSGASYQETALVVQSHEFVCLLSVGPNTCRRECLALGLVYVDDKDLIATAGDKIGMPYGLFRGLDEDFPVPQQEKGFMMFGDGMTVLLRGLGLS
jgi:hypothetical protein